MMLLSVKLIFLGLFLWTLSVVAKFLHNKWRLRMFPGPASFPLIGSLWDPAFITIYKHFHNMTKKYGKIVQFFAFTRPALLICDPVVARRILSDNRTFFKGEDYTVYFARVFGKGLVTANGEDHRHGRSILGKYFIRSSVAKFSENFNLITKAMIATYLSPLLADKPQGTDYNMEVFFARLALRCFMKFSCGVDTSVNTEFEESFCHIVSKGSYAMAVSVITKEPFYDFFPNSRALLKFNRVSAEFFQSCVAQRQAALAKGETFDDMLQALLDDKDATDQDRLDHFKTAISAGHDTTAFFMSYLVYLLARNQDIQEKLYNYLQEKLGDKEIVTADDIAQLKYLQCCMMETLRMYPTIPSVTRECAEDVHIKDENIDVVIPKGVNLFIPMVVLNKNPEIWPQPEKFDPSRFENKASADFTSAKDGFFPFSFGARICIGNTLAQIEASTVFVHLLRNFKFTEVEGFRPKIRAGISLTTSNGVEVHLEPRQR